MAHHATHCYTVSSNTLTHTFRDTHSPTSTTRDVVVVFVVVLAVVVVMQTYETHCVVERACNARTENDGRNNGGRGERETRATHAPNTTRQRRLLATSQPHLDGRHRPALARTRVRRKHTLVALARTYEPFRRINGQ